MHLEYLYLVARCLSSAACGKVSRIKTTVATCALSLLLAPAAAASTEVARDAQRPALRVDARGWAEVSWTANGARRTLLVPPRGRLLPGGRLGGRDVSRPARSVSIPFARVVRRTPDGRLWALQAWRTTPAGPVQLRFSRWRGAPTSISASFAPKPEPGGRIVGRAHYAGRPVTGTSPTPEGKRVRHYAWIDCFRCGGGTGWRRLIGVAPRADGTFALLLRPHWSAGRYRVSIAGPNRGATLAPDASAIVVYRPTAP